MNPLDIPWKQPWMDAALCSGLNPEDFFPIPGDADIAHAAMRVCAICPVRLQCLQYALITEGDLSRSLRYGIYGGMTPTQRAQLAAKGAAR